MQCHYFWGMSKFSQYTFSFYVQTSFFVIALLFLSYTILASHTEVTKVTYNQLLYLVLILVIILLGLTTSGGLTLAKLFLFAIALKEAKIDNTLRYFYRADIFCLLIIVLSALTGIIDNVAVQDGKQIRYNLGFNNLNTLAALIFGIVALDICINYERKWLSAWQRGFVGGVLIVIFTASRAAIISTAVLETIVFLDKRIISFRKVSGFIKKHVQYLFLVLGGGSLCVAKFYNGNSVIMTKINDILSWRLYFFNKYYYTFGVSVFGNNFSTNEYGPLDNAYLVLLFRYGIIIFFVYAFLFCMAAKWAYHEKNSMILYLFIPFCIYFFLEFTPLLINFDVPLIYFCIKFWSKMRGKKNGTNMSFRRNPSI